MSTRQPGKWAGLPVRNTLQLILLNSSVKYDYICEKTRESYIGNDGSKVDKKKRLLLLNMVVL